VGFEPTVTRTTVLEFYDSRVGLCRAVANRVLQFGIFPMIPARGGPCHAVPRGSFAIPFANPLTALSDFEGRAGVAEPLAYVREP
jgi:hypothetical protein